MPHRCHSSASTHGSEVLPVGLETPPACAVLGVAEDHFVPEVAKQGPKRRPCVDGGALGAQREPAGHRKDGAHILADKDDRGEQRWYVHPCKASQESKDRKHRDQQNKVE
eukprot:scaffold190121_cov34-Prasinocladus_malaysianus.AAC.1